MTTPSRSLPPAASLVAAAVGGAVGAVLRWVLTTLQPAPSGHLPWTVLVVNVVGSGLLAAVPLLPVARRTPWVAVLLGTGVLGGFTTMSTASTDTFALLDTGHPGLAVTYAVGTLVAALLAVALVHRVARPGRRTAVRAEEGDQ